MIYIANYAIGVIDCRINFKISRISMHHIKLKYILIHYCPKTY